MPSVSLKVGFYYMANGQGFGRNPAAGAVFMLGRDAIAGMVARCGACSHGLDFVAGVSTPASRGFSGLLLMPEAL